MSRLECDPAYNLDDPNECRACRDHGPCDECGGCEPRQLALDDALLAAQEGVAMKIASFYRFVDSLEGYADDDAAE